MRKTQKGKGEKGGLGEDRREESEREKRAEEYRAMTSLAHCFIHVVNIYSLNIFYAPDNG